MAEVQMTRAQAADPGSWPALCVFCGEPSSQLAEVPPKHRKGMEGLQVPVCPRHVRRWAELRQIERTAVVLLLLWLAACGVWIGFSNPFGPRAARNELPLLVLLGFLGLFIVAAIPL